MGHDASAAISEAMASFIASLPAGTPPHIAAKRFYSSMHESTDGMMEDFYTWLDARAVVTLTGEFRRLMTKAPVTRSKSGAFAEQAARFTAGEISALTDFRTVYTIDGVTKPLGEMTGPDHLAVSSGFTRMAGNALLLAAIHRQIARHLGNRKTADVFNAESYTALYPASTQGARSLPVAPKVNPSAKTGACHAGECELCTNQQCACSCHRHELERTA